MLFHIPGHSGVFTQAENIGYCVYMNDFGLSRLLDDCPRAAFRLAEAVASELIALMREGLDTLVEKDSD